MAETGHVEAFFPAEPTEAQVADVKQQMASALAGAGYTEAMRFEGPAYERDAFTRQDYWQLTAWADTDGD